MSAPWYIFVFASLALLSVSAFVAWLAAGWTRNRGLRAFSGFLLALIGLGLTAFVSGSLARPSRWLTHAVSYVFESVCVFFLPYLAFGIVGRSMPKWARAPYLVFCAVVFAGKIGLTLAGLTPLMQTLIAAVDTLITVFWLVVLYRFLGNIENVLTRRIVRRFTVVTFAFTPLLFYNVIGIPGFQPLFDAYLTDAFFFLAVACVILAESKTWLADLVVHASASHRPSIGISPAVGGFTPKVGGVDLVEVRVAPQGLDRTVAFARLSARQREIADLILDGLSAKEIAVRLDISPKTAENHTYALYRKFGARSRIQFYEMMRGRLAN